MHGAWGVPSKPSTLRSGKRQCRQTKTLSNCRSPLIFIRWAKVRTNSDLLLSIPKTHLRIMKKLRLELREAISFTPRLLRLCENICRGGTPWPPLVEAAISWESWGAWRWGGHGVPPLQMFSHRHFRPVIVNRRENGTLLNGFHGNPKHKPLETVLGQRLSRVTGLKPRC